MIITKKNYLVKETNIINNIYINADKKIPISIMMHVFKTEFNILIWYNTYYFNKNYYLII